MRIVSDGVVAH